MSLVAEMVDRLSGVSALREKVAQQDKILEGMQRILLEQQRELAELKGTLRAMVTMQQALPRK